jgi:capsular polysaccharide transport system permease protein
MSRVRSIPSSEGLSFGETLRAQWLVLVALILRDIKTRFFGSAWGFLLAIAWPLTHIGILLSLNLVTGRLPPYGDSAALWFATGIVPFMAFSYMSRFIMFGLLLNRPLLIFPHVKIMDVLLARAIVELLSAGLVILLLAFFFSTQNVDFAPVDTVQAFYALGSILLLGLGAGIINAILAQAIPGWATVYSLSMIFLWMVSGIFFIPDNLPEFLRYPASFSPILQNILWLRSAYFEGYGALTLDKSYTVGYGVVTLFSGLLLERLVRGRLLQG